MCRLARNAVVDLSISHFQVIDHPESFGEMSLDKSTSVIEASKP